MKIVYIWAMKKLVFLILISAFATTAQVQTCDKGCGKITKVEPTTIKGVKPNRALLIFKFVAPGGKPAKNAMKIVLDGRDTLYPKIDDKGISKLTTKPDTHKLKFMVKYWYSVKMENLVFKSDFTYTFLIKYEAKEIGATKSKDAD